MSPTRRVVLLVTAVVGLAGLAAMLPLESLPHVVEGWGPWGPAAAAAIAAALLVALVPRTPISLACGLLFGPGIGSLCALGAALTAAAATFAAGRWLGRDFMARREHGPIGRRWRRIDRWISTEGVLAVAAVRATPLGPYGLIGYAYGSSGVRPWHYAWGTLIATIPSAISYAVLGAAVGRHTDPTWLTTAPLLAGVALAGGLILRARLRARRRTPAAQPRLIVVDHAG